MLEVKIDFQAKGEMISNKVLLSSTAILAMLEKIVEM